MLFRSAAVAWGPRVIGVILTGDLDDGVAGLAEIKSAGGLALVQEPSSALAPSMPRNALQRVDVDHVVRLEEIAPLLVSLAGTAARERGPASARARTEVRMSLHESVAPEEFMQLGEPSIYACPECHGPLMAMKDRGFLRFRCHTGHAYSIDSLLVAFREQTEESGWSSIRAIEESYMLMDHVASDPGSHGLSEADARDLTARARLVQDQLEVLHRVLDQLPSIGKP